MGCIQSENILQTDINSHKCCKSEIAQLINEQYDLILADLQNCRKEIQQKTGIEMNDHILGYYQHDLKALSSYITKKQPIQNISNEIIKKQFDYYFDSNEQHYHYYLSLQWKDQVLSKYFQYNTLTQPESSLTETSFSLFSTSNSIERASLTNM
ncbi:hypothetical protein TTHERM_000842687 (macronuclear) [Tetrahymena thermophila SB210]|uniref:Uncharacterized protein n=1 Tax=Tetrahymena thermophila (strain SB210) TaxID=312017 RepID=W7WZV2_TETTS|nr:hypothetical protein TTHERM_000842687 [Tetrahymena thermophila SB210]EWS71132.1 hypothetical protein TTHERM_000842687 [Tetrahymena thermophila SB210]|eukprot:XP_012656340.1 hypothetical protein TTHERM_000842687 [Tetrahymena thermophila SB210]